MPSYSSKRPGVVIWIPHSLLQERREGTGYWTQSLPIFAFSVFGGGWKCDVFSKAHSVKQFSVVSQITLFQVCEGFMDKRKDP